jgi:hypothetical protein
MSGNTRLVPGPLWCHRPLQNRDWNGQVESPQNKFAIQVEEVKGDSIRASEIDEPTQKNARYDLEFALKPLLQGWVHRTHLTIQLDICWLLLSVVLCSITARYPESEANSPQPFSLRPLNGRAAY